MRRTRRSNEDGGMSFLDTLSCGFGAIILMIMLTRMIEPAVIEQSSRNLSGSVKAMQARVFELRGEDRQLTVEMNARQRAIAEAERQLASYQAQLQTQDKPKPPATVPEPGGTVMDKYALAKQTLTEEMERLLAGRKIRGNAIGGIPVDSEYLVFVIDTSGSMQSNAWPLVIKKLDEALAIYPRLKGIQVLDDEGGYMFPQYARSWIPDTPKQRKAILQRMPTWQPYSDSSPVEGIEAAISTFYSPDKNISIYVFGDDFAGQGSSFRAVLNTVSRLNVRDARGRRHVRIHAVGFPQNFQRGFGGSGSASRFAALMRELAQDNDGTFIALPSSR